MSDLRITPESPIRPDWMGLEGRPFSLSSGRRSSHYRHELRLSPIMVELDEDGFYTQRATDLQTRELLRADLLPDESLRPRLAAIDADVLEAVEELRLNTLLATTLGRPAESPWTQNELKWERAVIEEAGDSRAGNLLVARMVGLNYGEAFKGFKVFSPDLHALIDTMKKAPPRTWRDVLSYAERLQNFVREHETPPPPQPSQSGNSGADEKRQGDGQGAGEAGGGEGRRGDGEPQPGEGDGTQRSQRGEGDGLGHYELSSHQREQLMQQQVYDSLHEIIGAASDDPDEERAILSRFLFANNPNAQWGKMKIIECDLVLDHPIRYAARKIKPREFGDTFRFPERDVTDERVFGSMRHVRGGTILIDNSGSMALSHEDIMSLIRYAPNAEIAQYEGRRNDGDLKIIAHHGRVAAPKDLQRKYGNNTIDGPALEWLVTRKRPFMWVSDGQVHGKMDTHGGVYTSELLKKHVAQLTLRHHIRRATTIPDAIRVIQSGGFR